MTRTAPAPGPGGGRYDFLSTDSDFAFNDYISLA
jgi:hypothetical protein